MYVSMSVPLRYGKQWLRRTMNKVIPTGTAEKQPLRGGVVNSQRLCTHFLPKKKRFCTWPIYHAGQDDQFCSNHTQKPHSKHGKRIPCPIDSSHTIYEHRVKRHLEICSTKTLMEKEAALPCYSKDLNVKPLQAKVSTKQQVEKGADSTSNPAIVNDISELTKEGYTALISKLALSLQAKHLYKSDELTSQDIDGDGPKGKPRKPLAVKKVKHVKQIQSILDYLFQRLEIKDQACFVEMGAAKGGLSVEAFHRLQAQPGSVKPSFILVDRSSFKSRLDRVLTVKETDHWKRVRIDIRHLALNKFDRFKEGKTRVVYSKHLCGVATDYTINAVLNALHTDATVEKPRVTVILIALCCHHLCTSSAFPSEYLEQHNLSPAEFRLLCQMTSWATCNFNKKNTEAGPQKDRPFTRSLPRGERESVGYQCKDFINYGRVELLEKMGFDVSLCKYIDKECTLENKLLYAVRTEP